MEDPDRILLEHMSLGEETKKFLRSTVGQHIIQKSEDQIADALIKLRSVDPYDGTAVAKLQVQIKIAESIPNWLDEAITQGEQAYQIITEAEGTD